MTSTSIRRLRNLVARFRGQWLGVVGDLMLDRYIRGTVSRISPEAPVAVVEVAPAAESETLHPGGAANVVANLVALSAAAIPFGVIGRDEAGACLERELTRVGVPATGLVRDAARTTTLKMRIIAGHQHVVRADWEQRRPLGRSVERRLLERFQHHLPRLRGVILSDYDKGTLTENVLKVVLSSCAARRVPVFVDLKRWRPIRFSPALVVVNQRRAAEMTNQDIYDERSARAAGQLLREALGCAHLVITRGPEGMMLFDRQKAGGGGFAIRAIKTKPSEVFDVTGAGDTVIAVLALAFLAGASPQEAAELANHAAGIVVGKLGTATCSRAELLASLRQHAGSR